MIHIYMHVFINANIMPKHTLESPKGLANYLQICLEPLAKSDQRKWILFTCHWGKYCLHVLLLIHWLQKVPCESTCSELVLYKEFRSLLPFPSLLFSPSLAPSLLQWWEEVYHLPWLLLDRVIYELNSGPPLRSWSLYGDFLGWL